LSYYKIERLLGVRFSYASDTPKGIQTRNILSVICYLGASLIEIKHLYKSYDKKPVLKDVNLTVRRGAVTGLLGPNGAGKTTLISILTGIINKDSGSVTVDGIDLDRELRIIQSKCSYVPQSFAFYPRLTARENLEYFGALWGLKGSKLKERMDFCIDIGSMQSFVDKRAEKLSGGMKRRLNLAIGLLHDPEIVYLDEPTVGVDTQSRGYILATIKKINRERRATMIYTSHYMDEIEQVADDIAVINEGTIIVHDDTQAILSRADAASGHGSLEELFLKLTGTRLRDEE
jgi:ABC-2 type transport system ATP-binding protein